MFSKRSIGFSGVSESKFSEVRRVDRRGVEVWGVEGVSEGDGLLAECGGSLHLLGEGTALLGVSAIDVRTAQRRCY